MNFHIVSVNEWLYPDSSVDENGAKTVGLAAARGAYASCQILLNGVTPGTPYRWIYRGCEESALPQPEIFQMIDIFVEKNTGPVAFCVKEGESAEGYVTRIAPFRVYDALKPMTEGTCTRAETEALYASWKIPQNAVIGIHSGELVLEAGEDRCVIPVSVEVYAAVVPAAETLQVTNWFSLPNMAIRYGITLWSEEHWANIRKYGEIMRRARQTHFWVPMDMVETDLGSDGTYSFRFDRAERLIRMYLELGFTYIEGGMIAERKEFYDSDFYTKVNGELLHSISAEGYAYLSQYLRAWKSFLEDNGWLEITVQHVADEPIENSAPEYRILSGIVRKFMPGVPLIDAIESYDMAGSVDVWVPKNSYYEDNREKFEAYRQLGERLWYYTCCFPGGRYMNRLWDMPLLRTRFLHWGNYIYELEGYLHWGLNFCPDGKDPFEHIGLGMPPGDTHITYPGPDGPWGSIRLEAMRAGIEDYELLKLLEACDKSAADRIAASCVQSFHEMNEDPVHFDSVHRRLLQTLTEVSSSREKVV